MLLTTSVRIPSLLAISRCGKPARFRLAASDAPEACPVVVGDIRVRYTSLATYLFKRRIASRLLLSSETRLAMYSEALSSPHILLITMLCSARFA